MNLIEIRGASSIFVLPFENCHVARIGSVSEQQKKKCLSLYSFLKFDENARIHLPRTQTDTGMCVCVHRYGRKYVCLSVLNAENNFPQPILFVRNEIAFAWLMLCAPKPMLIQHLIFSAYESFSFRFLSIVVFLQSYHIRFLFTVISTAH